MSERIKINLKVNGEDVTYDIAPEDTLLKALRANYNYDVKNVCEIGECGACTVLLDGEAVKSCVTLAAACEGHEVWTDKGLGEQDKLAARLQDAFVECGSVQCGICIPDLSSQVWVTSRISAIPTERASASMYPATSAAAQVIRRSSTQSKRLHWSMKGVRSNGRSKNSTELQIGRNKSTAS